VNAAVLNALGPRGVVVNIARGSVIDTAALAAALREGRLAAAGLDVYESEPAPPAELLDLDNVVLTPHVAGWSPEAVQNSVDRFMENALRHLAGEAPATLL
jgi:lactate dehydrogenase-like 2-hydroxyacid dehydrogenase